MQQLRREQSWAAHIVLMSTPGLGRVKTLPQGISWTRPRVLDEGRPYAQFMIHSSELMPGGSPTFRGTDDIQKLYDDLEALFDSVEDRFVGTTLADFAAAATSSGHGT